MDSSLVAMKMSSNNSYQDQQQQPPHLSFKTLSSKRERTARSEVINNNNNNTETLSYRECQKNHAASIGGHALDGCGEYMPSPSLKCAACGCHRNFHRLHNNNSELHGKNNNNNNSNSMMKTSPSPNLAAAPIFSHRPRRFSSTSPSTSSSPSRSEAPISSIYPSAPQILMTLSCSGNTTTTTTTPDSATKLCFFDQDLMKKTEKKQSKEKEQNNQQTNSARKRFRTKFSGEQKEKMRRFAEGLGWRMQRSDDEGVRRFCEEIGVCKSVLKVWMHNNKSRNTMGFSAGEFERRVRAEDEMNMMVVEGVVVAGNNGGGKQSMDGGSSSSP